MRSLGTCLLAGLVAGVGLAGHVDPAAAQSRLVGDAYSFSAENFPDDFGVVLDPVSGIEMDWGSPPVELTFDGVEEPAGDMLVSERAFAWEGVEGGIRGVNALRAAAGDENGEVDLLDWENAGEVVEFSFRTANGGWIAQQAEFAHSFFAIRGLDWANSVAESLPTLFGGSLYFWFGQDGAAVDGMNVAVDEDIYITEHPFDPAIPQVVMIENGTDEVEEITNLYPGGMDFFSGTTQLNANASWTIVANAVGLPDFAELGGRDANELHIGFLVAPPESAQIVLPGDVNLDGTVDLIDFNLLKSNFGRSGEEVVRAHGDLNGDFAVDLVDFNLLKGDFGNSAPVPEPAAVALAALASIALLTRRRLR